jgi:uncharacterized membrane protein
MTARMIARGAAYAALYVALTMVPGLHALAYRDVQFRVAECLLVFVFFDRAALPGIVVGTAIANGFGPMAVVDVWFGALLTLVAGLAMQRAGAHVIALAIPVLVNGLGVPVELHLLLDLPFWASVVWVSLGEAVVMFGLGLPLLLLVRAGAFAPVLGDQGRRGSRECAAGAQGGTTV